MRKRLDSAICWLYPHPCKVKLRGPDLSEISSNELMNSLCYYRDQVTWSFTLSEKLRLKIKCI